MKISILIPSVNGFELLSECINSIFENISNEHKIEVIVKLDFDDDTILKINDLKYKEHIKILISDKGLGYGGIHNFLNEMLKLCSDSDWIQLFNDDALFLTKKWDKLLEIYNPNDIWLLRHNRCEGRVGDIGDYYFPFISRKYHEVVERITGGPSYDGYLLNIADDLRIWERLPIDFYHRHAHELKQIPDKNNQMNNSRKSINEALELQIDKNKIRNYLKK